MSEPPKDLETDNDSRPVEYELAIVLKWAKQAGYLVVASAVQRALIELSARAKCNTAITDSS